MNGTGLVRGPSSRLAEGIVTHISRMPVDMELAWSQHAAYADALAASGWAVRAAPAADDCPDSVFVEDTVVICEDLAVLTRPGALAPLGRTVVGVPLGKVLHLKSAVTALPDGTFLLLPELVPAELFPAVRPVTEEGGSHVVPLGGDRVLIAASAPRTAALIEDLGYMPVVVDISEFEKLEGCVTCLSVLVPGR
jgi:dimethylargininase